MKKKTLVSIYAILFSLILTAVTAQHIYADEDPNPEGTATTEEGTETPGAGEAGTTTSDTAAVEEMPAEKTKSMYRMYNPNSGEHFYTANAAERAFLIKAGWRYEGVGWTAPETSEKPVYRLYKPNAGDHHYTMREKERDHLVSVGWRDEGIGWYSDTEERAPIYREYNPNAETGSHNYTGNHGEHDWLVSLGWRDEGIGWYAVQNGGEDDQSITTDPEPEGGTNEIKVIVLGDGKYRLSLTDLSEPEKVTFVRFFVWSEANGQDDIFDYTATREEDGSWDAVMETKNHKDGGLFHVHAYVTVDGAEEAEARSTATFEVDPAEMAGRWVIVDGFYRYFENGKYADDVRPYLGDLFGTKTVANTFGQVLIAPNCEYTAEVDRTNCIVTIYTSYPGTTEQNLPVCAFLCSPGRDSSPTDPGYWRTTARAGRWHELMGPSYGQFCTRIHGGELFHSVACGQANDHNLNPYEYNRLGTKQSHGCVRLCVRNAYWIYTFCEVGMLVHISDNLPMPLAPVFQPKMQSDQRIDPTDPAYTGNYEYCDNGVYYDLR